MTLFERVDRLNLIIDDLTSTTSLNEKRLIVDEISDELKQDFNRILEVLAGKYVFGYTFKWSPITYDVAVTNGINIKDWTICDCIDYLLEPMMKRNLTQRNIEEHCEVLNCIEWFLEPIVNRTLRLGIGRSLLEKDSLSPMLAKKYEGDLPRNSIFVTEKLDGNRCIAYYDGNKWNFKSRNGKDMHVYFDMNGLPTDLVYDGEVMSKSQVQLSNYIYDVIQDTTKEIVRTESEFNEVSGLINRHTLYKDLVYNIFDIVSDDIYIKRRNIIDNLKPLSNDVRILPKLLFLQNYDLQKTRDTLDFALDRVTEAGGEGLMINIADASYKHKRTDALLKYKKVQTMDMLVLSTYGGTGKYEGLVGGINCEAFTSDDKHVLCSVGSGLSDEQRYRWTDYKSIVGKIVEIAYFGLSQEKALKGTSTYSLRFPRLKSVRIDKKETSEF